jgi:hypothetical protein
MATLGEIERILWQVPELAQPNGFEVMKTAHGGGRPWHPERRFPGFEDANSVLESEFRLWFFAPEQGDRRRREAVESGGAQLTVVFNSSLTCGDPAVKDALWKAYQTLNWAAIKRIVDRPW